VYKVNFTGGYILRIFFIGVLGLTGIFFPLIAEETSKEEVLKKMSGELEVIKEVTKISEKVSMALKDNRLENDMSTINTAIEELKQILKKYPDCAAAHWELGWLYARKKEKEEAKRAFGRAVELDPSYKGFIEELANVFDSNHKTKKSDTEKEDKLVKKISKDLERIIRQKGDRNFVKEVDNAIKKYKTILSENPKCASAYDALGTAYLYKKRFKYALDNYEKAIKLDSENAFYLMSLAKCYETLAYEEEENKRYEEAMKYYNKAWELYQRLEKKKPGNPFIAFQIKDIEASKKYIVKSEKEEKLDKYWKLAKAASDKDEYEQSIKYLKKIAKIEPNYNNTIYYNIARRYKYWGKYKMAKKLYEKHILLNPDEMPELLYSHRGLMDCYFEMEKFDRVREEIKIVLKLDPYDKRAKRYLKKINKLEKQK